MRRLTLILASAVLLLAGCTSGNDSDGSGSGGGGSDGGKATTGSADPAPSPSATKTAEAEPEPACDTIWTAGAVLPADYGSCVADGEEAVQDVTECTDGTSLVVYLDSFYAITGQKIVEPEVAPLQDTDEFGAAYSACTGE